MKPWQRFTQQLTVPVNLAQITLEEAAFHSPDVTLQTLRLVRRVLGTSGRYHQGFPGNLFQLTSVGALWA